MDAAMSPLKTNSQALYDADYLRWIETTVKQLRCQDYATVDWENLIEEIEDMGRSERRSLESNLIVILLHLLKWQFQPEHRSGSWESRLIEHRRRVQEALGDSPSLKPCLDTTFDKCYAAAVKQAKAETGLPLEAFPPQSPYSPTEVLNDEFLPA
jgi:hypothetical protein